jgi:hypothetical protein
VAEIAADFMTTTFCRRRPVSIPHHRQNEAPLLSSLLLVLASCTANRPALY